MIASQKSKNNETYKTVKQTSIYCLIWLDQL